MCRLIQAPGSLADVFRASPGILAFTFADLGDGTNCAAARTWVAANVADLGHLTENRTGRLGLVVGELTAVAA